MGSIGATGQTPQSLGTRAWHVKARLGIQQEGAKIQKGNGGYKPLFLSTRNHSWENQVLQIEPQPETRLPMRVWSKGQQTGAAGIGWEHVASPGITGYGMWVAWPHGSAGMRHKRWTLLKGASWERQMKQIKSC